MFVTRANQCRTFNQNVLDPSVGNDKPNTPVDQCPTTKIRMSQPGVADAKSVDDYSITT